jgi:hypothetical protein
LRGHPGPRKITPSIRELERHGRPARHPRRFTSDRAAASRPAGEHTASEAVASESSSLAELHQPPGDRAERRLGRVNCLSLSRRVMPRGAAEWPAGVALAVVHRPARAFVLAVRIPVAGFLAAVGPEMSGSPVRRAAPVTEAAAMRVA